MYTSAVTIIIIHPNSMCARYELFKLLPLLRCNNIIIYESAGKPIITKNAWEARTAVLYLYTWMDRCARISHI